jgi:ABC-2 type transport system ATP-binding protein
MTWAVETLDLSKTFAPLVRLLVRREPTVALDGVTLTVPEGSVFGLLGPNGAGKTTFIKLLCGLVLPTRGSARVAGLDLLRESPALHARVGLVTSDERSFYWRLTARQNLEFFATLYDLQGRARHERVEEILSLVGLTSDADRRFSDYSSGMKQRLAVARGLLHDPDILFLDEPTKGLDPLATRRVHALIKDLVQRGKTVVMATQQLHEAETLCHRVAFFRRGHVLAEGSPTELAARFADADRYELRVAQLSETTLAQLTAMFPSLHVAPAGDGSHTLVLPVTPSGDDLSRVLSQMVAGGGVIREVNRVRLELEELFTRIVQA